MLIGVRKGGGGGEWTAAVASPPGAGCEGLPELLGEAAPPP